MDVFSLLMSLKPAEVSGLVGVGTLALGACGFLFGRRDARLTAAATTTRMMGDVVSAMDTLNKELRAEIATARGEGEAMKARLSDLEKERDRLLARIRELESQVTTIGGERDQLRARVSEL